MRTVMLVVVLGCWPLAAWAQSANPHRVADVNTAPSKRSGALLDFMESQTKTFVWFSSYDSFGRELWATDGTTIGTVRLTDLVPGFGNSDPKPIGSLGNTLIFSAVRPDVGRELFAVDGNDPSTVRLLREFVPGTANGMPDAIFSSVAGAVLNGVLYFAAGPTTDTELWKTDGTTAGTTRVLDLNPTGSSAPTNFTLLGTTRIIFTAKTPAAGLELWTTTGTAASTVLVADLNPGVADSTPQYFLADGAIAYFNATEASTGNELWKTDGTPAGTVRLTDINPGASGSNAYPLTTMYGTTVFFRANGPAGYELYRYDTLSGLTLFDIEPGSGSSTPTDCAAFPPQVVCFCRDTSNGIEVYEAVYTTVRAVGDLIPGPMNASVSVIATSTSSAIVAADRMKDGNVLSVGSSGYTTNSGLTYGSGSIPAFGGAVMGASDGTSGEDLWFVTSSLSRKIYDFQSGTASSSPTRFVASGDRVFFAANTSDSELANYDLFETRGTPETTQRINSGLGYTPPGLSIALSKLFVGYAFGGTIRSLDLATLTDWQLIGSTYSNPLELNGRGYFIGGSGLDLWVTDGKTSGTSTLVDFSPGNIDPNQAPIAFRTGFLFSASTTAADSEPYFSDGTAAGTTRIVELNATGGSYPHLFTVLGNQAFFTAITPTTGYELFVTDGTAAGTHLVADLTPGTSSTSIADLRAINGKLYFTVAATDLWVSDGTAAGTVRLAQAVSPAGSEVEMGGKVYFAGNTTTQGRELWVTDGTPAGTMLAVDVRAGLEGASPTGLLSIGAELLFVAKGDAAGLELWRSDGTAAGTRRVSDIAVGAPDSNPKNLLKVGAKVYFSATDSSGDEEPWVYELDQTPPVVTPALTGTLGLGGFYTSNVSVRFTVTDPESASTLTPGCAGLDVTEDTAGLVVNCSAQSIGGTTPSSVTVKRDTHVPQLICPADLSVEATASSGAQVTLPVPMVSDAIDTAPVVTTLPGSGTFTLGATGVVATAKDAAGNASTCRFDVIVRDTTAPTIQCPADQSVTGSSSLGAFASFEVTATDTVDGAPLLVVDHPSGSLFAIGDTQVKATALDHAGNSASCTFKVTATEKKGCGCGSAEGVSALFALVLVARRRSKRSESPA